MRSKLVIDKINAMKMKLLFQRKGNESKRSWIWDKVIINCLAQIKC